MKENTVEAIQLLGVNSYMREYNNYEGANEIQKLIINGSMFG